MNEELLKKVEELDKEYFGARTLDQFMSALMAQIQSIKKEPTTVNTRKQVGDLLFIIVSLARNMKWDLGELLQEVVHKVENRRADRHYYEAHVTIDPVFDDRLKQFDAIARAHGFRVATLLMQKRKEATPERGVNDSFCTGRSISYSDIKDRMIALLTALRDEGFRVWRYKIESTLLDSRYDDAEFQLDHREIPDKEMKPSAPATGALPGRKHKAGDRRALMNTAK